MAPAAMRAPAFESLNDQGRGTKWSVGPGGGLEEWGGHWLWRDYGLETSGSRPPTKTVDSAVGRRPPGPGPGRPIARLPRRISQAAKPMHWRFLPRSLWQAARGLAGRGCCGMGKGQHRAD